MCVRLLLLLLSAPAQATFRTANRDVNAAGRFIADSLVASVSKGVTESVASACECRGLWACLRKVLLQTHSLWLLGVCRATLAVSYSCMRLLCC